MFAAYEVSVKLKLANGISAGLAVIAGEMGTLNRHVGGAQAGLDVLHGKLTKIRNVGLVGGAMIGAGVGMLALLKGPYEEAKKLAQAQANFQTLNLSAAENSEAFGKAASMSHKILGTTITENVKGIHDLHTAFGDLHHAISTADDFAKFSFIAKTMNEGAPVDGLVYNAAKALEHRGGKVMNNDATFKTELDLMERVYLGSRGKVNPGEFFHASQTGKLAYTLMDKEELYGPFAAYMQSKSGATAGTAAMTFSSSLIGGHMTSKAKGFLADLDLWDEGTSKKRLAMLKNISAGMSPEERKNMGMLTPTSGGLKEQFVDLAVHRQSEFVQKILVPAIRKRFGMDMSDEAVAVKLMSVFNRNTSDFMGEYVVNAMKFKKDAGIFQATKGIGNAYQHYLNTPEGAEAASSAAWKNFLAVFGSVYLPSITNGLLQLAGGLDKLSQWVDRNKGLVKGLVYAFGALAGGLVIGGTVLVLSAAFRGLGLAMLFKTAGGPAVLGWIARGLSAIGTAIGAAGFVSTLLVIGAAFAGWKLGKWFNDAFLAGTKFSDWIGSVVAHLMAPFSSDAREAIKKNSGQEWYEFGPKFGVAPAPGGPAPKPWLPFGSSLPPKLPASLPVKPPPPPRVLLTGAFKIAQPAWASADTAPLVAKPIATPAQAGRMINNTIVMPDGRVLASVVTKEQTKAASRPQTGSGSFNTDMTPMFPGTTR